MYSLLIPVLLYEFFEISNIFFVSLSLIQNFILLTFLFTIFLLFKSAHLKLNRLTKILLLLLIAETFICVFFNSSPLIVTYLLLSLLLISVNSKEKLISMTYFSSLPFLIIGVFIYLLLDLYSLEALSYITDTNMAIKSSYGGYFFNSQQNFFQLWIYKFSLHDGYINYMGMAAESHLSFSLFFILTILIAKIKFNFNNTLFILLLIPVFLHLSGSNILAAVMAIIFSSFKVIYRNIQLLYIFALFTAVVLVNTFIDIELLKLIPDRSIRESAINLIRLFIINIPASGGLSDIFSQALLAAEVDFIPLNIVQLILIHALIYDILSKMSGVSFYKRFIIFYILIYSLKSATILLFTPFFLFTIYYLCYEYEITKLYKNDNI